MSNPFIPTTDPAAIAANRQGMLTEEQQKEIVIATPARTWGFAIGGFLLLGALSICVFSELGADAAIGIIGTVIGLVVLFCAYRGVHMLLLRRKLLSDNIEMADGQVVFVPGSLVDPSKFVAETADNRKLYVLGLIGLGVNLRPGPYRFYYLPKRKWLVSAEPLAGEDALNANLLDVLAATHEWDASSVRQLGRLSAAQLAEQQIAVREGIVKTTSSSHTVMQTGSDDLTVYDYYYELDDLRFQVSEAAYAALVKGLRYRLYYTGGQLLGLEPLGE